MRDPELVFAPELPDPRFCPVPVIRAYLVAIEGELLEPDGLPARVVDAQRVVLYRAASGFIKRGPDGEEVGFWIFGWAHARPALSPPSPEWARRQEETAGRSRPTTSQEKG